VYHARYQKEQANAKKFKKDPIRNDLFEDKNAAEFYTY
jgi:hypothetical protein